MAFGQTTLKAEAKRLADQPFSKPTMDALPAPFNKLSYDQYRDIRFRSEKAIWKGEHLGFQVQPFAMGWLYDVPVDLWIVENGKATRLVADSNMFSFGPLIGPGPDAAPFGFSGFRIHGPINRADAFEEYTVFQGASYLRAVGPGEVWRFGKRVGSQHRTTGRRGISVLSKFLDRKTETARNRNRRPCVARQSIYDRRLPVCDRTRRDDGDGCRSDFVSASGAEPRRHRSFDEHVFPRAIEPTAYRRHPSCCARQRGACHG